ncbi:MAG: hypothetical protein OEU26_00175 [Candidatus Tectomicrobia bacterium]|nr:hypothetical protein [Candidatus Tectomicrobia bacterium]
MATKPTERILDWASGGTNTDPGGAKEAAGWLVAERPPAYWWNWILNSFGKWLTYFEAVDDEVGTRAVSHVTITAGAATQSTNSTLSSVSAGAAYVTCTLTDAMTDTDYMVFVADSVNGGTTHLSVSTVSTTQFRVYLTDNTGSQITPNDSGTNNNFYISVQGGVVA